MIAAGSAEAKDIDAQPDKSSDAAPAATSTPKTRQIAVEPTAAEETPTETKPSDKVAKAPDSGPKISAPEKQVAADGEVEEEGDGASLAPEVKRLERPDPVLSMCMCTVIRRLMGMADTDQPTKVP